MDRAQRCERIAHRGANREYPENTLPAFARALERGADAIELDVHATRDGVVVVHHDPALDARAGAAAGRAIADLDWRALRAVELGDGAGVPRLEDVLATVPPDATTYVEIKGSRIEERVAAVLRTSGARCAVHSFDHDAIATMRRLAPEIPRGVLFDRPPADPAAAMAAVAARDLWPAWREIDAELVQRVHAAGGRVIAWTVDTRSDAAALVALGVDGICTDDVRILDGL